MKLNSNIRFINPHLFILLAIMLWMTPITSLSATEYYVDNLRGNDRYSGLCPNPPNPVPDAPDGACGPFFSARETMIKSAPGGENNTFFQPGDSILLHRGRLWRESTLMFDSGEPGNPITIAAYGDPKLRRPVIRSAYPLGSDRDNLCFDWVETEEENIWELVQNAGYCSCDNNLCGPDCDEECSCYCYWHEDRFCKGSAPSGDPIRKNCGYEQLIFDIDLESEKLGRKRRMEGDKPDSEWEWRFVRYEEDDGKTHSYYFRAQVYSTKDPDTAYNSMDLIAGSALQLGNIYDYENPYWTRHIRVRDLELQAGTHTLELKLVEGVVVDNVKIKYGYDTIRMGSSTINCTIRNSEISNPYHVGINCLGAPDLGSITPVQCSGNLIEHNLIMNDPEACNYAEPTDYDSDCGMLLTIYGREPIVEKGIEILGAFDNVVRYNMIYNNQGDGDNKGDWYVGRGGGGIRMSGHDNAFYYNIVAESRDSGVGISSSGSGGNGNTFRQFVSKNNKIFNNVIYGSNGPGITQVEYECKMQDPQYCLDNYSRGNQIFNNILYDNDRDRFSWSMIYPLQNPPDVGNCPTYEPVGGVPGPPPDYDYRIQVLVYGLNTGGENYKPSHYRNNMIFSSERDEGEEDLVLFHTREDVDNNQCWKFTTTAGLNQKAGNKLNLESEPGFISYDPREPEDFQLSESSPAIDYGTDTWSLLREDNPNLKARDFAGKAIRPEATIDVGAFEYPNEDVYTDGDFQTDGDETADGDESVDGDESTDGDISIDGDTILDGDRQIDGDTILDEEPHSDGYIAGSGERRGCRNTGASSSCLLLLMISMSALWIRAG